MATIQKQTFNRDNIVDNHLWLIDQIREETLQKIEKFLGNRNVKFEQLIEFLKKPIIYPGKIVGLKQIIERFLNLTISNYYKKIQAEGLSIKFVINTVRENLFQDGLDIKRDLNITMAIRGGDDARKTVSASRIDEPPRLLLVKNKAFKTKSNPKKRGPKVISFKFPKEDAELRGSCDYCKAYIKLRYTSNFTHINMCQNPTHRHFCSKECKISWIFSLNEINEKISQED